MSTTATRPTPLSAARYLAWTGALFESAAAITGVVERQYRIAQRRVVVRTAGTELMARTDPALHARSIKGDDADATPADLTVEAWDSASSGVLIGRAPWEPDDLRPLGLVRTHCDDRFRTAVDVHTASLSQFDAATSRARFWLHDAARMAYWQSASPLRLIVSWWAAQWGGQLTHAAAVVADGAAVLVVGGAGAGKSTTALMCLRAGLGFLGDDYCLVTAGAEPRVHAVYATAKLRPDGLELLPDLVPAVTNLARVDREKAIVALADRYDDQLVADAPLRAIVVPRVTGTVRSERVSAGTVLRAMAPSTIFGLFGATPGTLAQLAAIARQVPGYVLEVGDDPVAVAGEIARLAGRGA
jgi:hypothetical protein